MSTSDLKKYEKKKKEIKNEVFKYLRKRKGQWISEEKIKKDLDLDFDFVDVDEALSGEVWSIGSRIESKSAKVPKDGYYERIEFFKFKPFWKSIRIVASLLLLFLLIGLLIFHIYIN
ncbi:MAG: hypothetical protein BTN85_0700 [Candidatus Methanohalarchaeum thermophilum]|uniref:Uncharacterized protein n=1 Tax=Methanohalarchaeum thermophilum TaxID=1903181 RepID=A0A1Q6DV29_METT1|nr:MAG: hypothetical protein BTN85_0700 [Candidatus Methanohalarchaeum thermophilum]